jgi:predicted O-methyltransferase YrrM
MSKISGDTQENGVHEIRPKIIFEKIENEFQDTNINFTVNIPSSKIGGLTLLESSILISLLKLLNSTQIFEFGTYMGATSVLLAQNSSVDARITTLDIEPDEMAKQQYGVNKENIENEDYLRNDSVNDNYLRGEFANKGAIYINQANDDLKQKIIQIYSDSRTLDLQSNNFVDRFDFIFIDGGHDYETIKNDTEKALQMVKDDSIVIWHDYRSQIHGDVTRFVDLYSSSNSIIHVQSTMLAFMLNGKFQSMFFPS